MLSSVSFKAGGVESCPVLKSWCGPGAEAASTLAVRVQPESQAMPPMPQAPLPSQVAAEPVVQIPYEESLGPKWWNCLSGFVRYRIGEEILLNQNIDKLLTSKCNPFLKIPKRRLLALQRAKSCKIMDRVCQKRIWKPQVTV